MFERSSVYWRGTETLDGARTYLVVAHPTTETLQSLPDADSRSVDYSRGDIDNATFKLWVDAETYRPVKSSIRIELSSGDASATASMTTRYRDYDAPVRATIPDMTEATRYRLGCPKT